MSENIVISKKSNLKGDDGYRVFSLRVKETTVIELDKIASDTNRSRNEIINGSSLFQVGNAKSNPPASR